MQMGRGEKRGDNTENQSGEAPKAGRQAVTQAHPLPLQDKARAKTEEKAVTGVFIGTGALAGSAVRVREEARE